jgi:ethanolamine utilization microcompartment shell protein EutS
MKKQIFTIILLLMGGVSTFGQFKFDGGVNSVRLQTNGVDRMYIQPSGINSNTGSVGINTINPDAKLTINGDMSFKSTTRFIVNGGYQAVNRNGSSVLIFEAGGVLNGIAGGVDGMLLYVLCGYKMPATTTTGALIIKHEDSAFETVAANRIMTHTGADFTIPTGTGGVMMIYDGGRQRWRIMEVTSGSGSFSGWGLTGNGGSNPTTDFMGTTDAQPLAFKTSNTERMRILSSGNVGIGTTTPDTKLDVNGDISLTKRILNLNVIGQIDNLDLQGAAVHKYEGNVASNVTITGIAGGTEGKIVILYTASSSTITLKHLSSSSSSINQILTNTLADVSVTNGAITLIYDADSARWRILSVTF